MAEPKVQVTLTHDEWVLLLNALHVYARGEDLSADGWPEASAGWEHHLAVAQQANSLHSKLAPLFGERP